ncbi:OmpA family protein [Marinigracilibium pacificum]|uniref:OmpA family protein n=1 Tax=Marinigracilibium pacificum TaxID=2729599 RepID=A0A848J4H7_9BACT|nr:OmpA family protein [Marinigracilibium pacificum]NMM48072.1 OmpA family protein [Marinigracilibium pacificum]
MIFCNFLTGDSKINSFRSVLIVLLLFVLSVGVDAQPLPYDRPVPTPDKSQTLAPGYYVVVGAFRQTENAITMMTWLRRRLVNYNYGYVPERDLFYIYAYQLAEKRHANHLVQDVRDRSYYDAWVYAHQVDGIAKSGIQYQEVSDILNDYSSQAQPIDEPSNDAYEISEGVESPVSQVSEEFTIEEKAEKGELYIKFITQAVQTGEEIESTIYVYNDEAGQNEILRVNSNQSIPFEIYNMEEDMIRTRVSTFGYKSVEKDIYPGNFNKTLAETEAELKGDTLNVKYDLERYTKGDIAVMYAVYFYTDAAILKVASKKQLNELVRLLNENQELEIQINGHTNGDTFGKIQTLKDSDDNFFGLSSNNKSFLGTAKRLSEERAEIIKRFLVFNGIDEARITTKGWGGEKPLYDVESKDAINNMRVEIEVLKN